MGAAHEKGLGQGKNMKRGQVLFFDINMKRGQVLFFDINDDTQYLWP